MQRRHFLSGLAAVAAGAAFAARAERNPARILGELARSTGSEVDQASFDAAAAYCEQSVLTILGHGWEVGDIVDISISGGRTLTARVSSILDRNTLTLS